VWSRTRPTSRFERANGSTSRLVIGISAPPSSIKQRNSFTVRTRETCGDTGTRPSPPGPRRAPGRRRSSAGSPSSAPPEQSRGEDSDRIRTRRSSVTAGRNGDVDMSWCQEVVSKCALEAAADDDRAGEFEEGLVELGSSFPAGADPAPAVQPGVGAFDRPALSELWVSAAAFAVAAAGGDRWFDPALEQTRP